MSCIRPTDLETPPAVAWSASWINDGTPLPGRDEEFYAEDPAPLLRKPFTVAGSVAEATLSITAAGYYVASINGSRVGDHVLDPGWTNYAKRVLYSSYDVTAMIRPGSNALGVTLGNGWYNPLPLRLWGGRNLRDDLPTGRPALLAQLDICYADGTRARIVSDASWCWHAGPILRNNIYLGEHYDARCELPGWDTPGYDDASWQPVTPAPPPGGKLEPQGQPPIRTTETIAPVAITEPSPGVYLVDMGQNLAGGVSLRIKVPAGTQVAIRYGELLHEDGSLNGLTSVCGQIKKLNPDRTPKGGPGAPEVAWQQDHYIARGNADGECYTPTFTWHAYRYIEITGLPYPPELADITGLRQHSDVREAGSFSCSNDLFNDIQAMTRRTFLSNLFSVQSDCPHRERFGYGGDLAVTCEAFMANFDMAQFYAKAVRDWGDAQHPDGMLPDTAPSIGMQYCGLGWAMAHPLLLATLYRVYGNRELIEEQYDCAARWMASVGKEFPEHIIQKGLSDHEALEAAKPPVMVTPLYYQCARIMETLASVLGRSGDADKYSQLAEAISTAYVTAFVDLETGTCGPGIQGSQAFALYTGILPEAYRPKALALLVDNIVDKHDGHMTTGIFGTRFLLELLSSSGHADVAYDMVAKRDFPGWGHMLENGATTLWETWAFSDNTYSHNHPMFGSVSEWFFKHVVGIQIDADALGANKITIHPKVTHRLDWARASYQSVHGEIACHWYWESDTLHIDVTVPEGVTARIVTPENTPVSATLNGAHARV